MPQTSIQPDQADNGDMTGVLQNHQVPADEPAPASRPRVLMLTHRLPYPPDRGDRIRSYHMLKALAEHFEVALACTSDDPVWLQHHRVLHKLASRVAIQPTSASMSACRGLWAMIRGRPITPACFYRQSLADVILQWHRQQPFDLVLTFCTGMIHYARLLTSQRDGKQRLAHVLDLVDVDSAKWHAYAQQAWAPMRWVYAREAFQLRRIESGQFDTFDALTVVSDAEAAAYREHVNEYHDLHVVGNGVDLDYFRPLQDTADPVLVFVGVLNYRPNADGIAWFVHQVMPLLRERVPAIRLRIVGRHPSRRVMALGREPGVEVVGSVPDVRVYMQQAAAVVAPLRIARGVQNKVLEAMACAKPVVCSSQAAEGIDALPGEHLLVAQCPEDWIGHITQLLDDDAYRQAVGQAGREQVVRCGSWSSQLTPLVELLQRLTPVQPKAGI